MADPRPLHRLFGLAWIDFFRGTSIEVETEIDLSLKQQLLDLILIRRQPGPIPRILPDGFEELAEFNLITFKSHHEALDGWALCELVGHYVNYRKQSSPSWDALLPEGDYRLFAVCARYPQNLAQAVTMIPIRDGVFDVDALGLRIRVVVLSQLPEADQNAMLHLFSARVELLRYGREHYRPHSAETSSLLLDLFKTYSEDQDMPDKLQEFVLETRRKLLQSMTPEQRMEGLTSEELTRWVQGLPREVLENALRESKASDAVPRPQ